MCRRKETIWLMALLLVLLMITTKMSSGTPLLGARPDFEDNSRVQGKLKPIFIHCDEIGNHLNCMLYCKSRGHADGNCGGDFTCNCF